MTQNMRYRRDATTARPQTVEYGLIHGPTGPAKTNSTPESSCPDKQENDSSVRFQRRALDGGWEVVFGAFEAGRTVFAK
jgi:hypothetical protein